MATWFEDVYNALEGLGGEANLSEVYDAVRSRREEALPKSWKEVVRKEIEANSSDSRYHQGKRDVFYSVNGIGEGRWGIRRA